ncbi:glucomannan 4-beta-mannosyltransferase 2-like [Populus alba x Populus x berolinensis]|uniref:glucomannan 4-beta-mannosyltransferase n=1 Tax=Populus alba x Populus x berolinensis TaxID=444605 RepID=A0AAD6QDA3_9ROSI|nr:glucomannan 4-beta-mannosyltransferase 2-like [Populus alba x Populus x berolinensis]
MAEVSPKVMIPESFQFQVSSSDIAGQLTLIWELLKAPLIVPLLTLGVYICLAMSLMLFMERVYMGIVIILVKLFWKKPDKRYKWEPMQDDLESGNLNFPVVLVQIPMFNEREVYKLSIGAASNLSWPADRLVIQVLDDSTDPAIKQMVELECQRWASKGINIRYQIRENRTGYKAGALKEGLKRSYVKHCEYVCIFDADFQPEPDYLRRAIPFLIHNPDIALVQGRWRFVNADECLLTRMQEMSLDYHFTVEQEVGSATHAFFGFNGTAGVWRIAAINEAGGWKDRTTVEDMDLAVRASLRGWKFLYLGDLQVKSELPSTFKAFRFQQHRWSCGPANLFRKMVMEIVRNKKVRFWKKVYVIYSFFFVRKIIAHMVTFSFYCVVLPLTILVPEVKVPIWGAVYIPSVITILNSVGTPRSIHLLFYWILFENVMSLHRTKATFIGLLEAGRANEWVVTEKLGNTLQKAAEAKKSNPKAPRKFRFKFTDSIDASGSLALAALNVGDLSPPIFCYMGSGISESGTEEAQGERVSGESIAEHLASIFGTEKDRVNCPFYFKTRACRHGDRCSRLHTKPSISRTLLLSNMYRRPDMITPGVNALGNPIDPRKIQQYFEVGNVYVRFREQERASNALQDLTWRLYAGRLIIAGFSPVTDFCEATCRQYEETVCNRGGYCKKRNWQLGTLTKARQTSATSNFTVLNWLTMKFVYRLLAAVSEDLSDYSSKSSRSRLIVHKVI